MAAYSEREQKTEGKVEKKVIDLEIGRPLIDCIYSCETLCVADCCGISAFENSPSQIQRWIRAASRDQIRAAAGQVNKLILLIADSSCNYSSEQLNHFTGSQESRQDLLEFLKPFKTVLAESV